MKLMSTYDAVNWCRDRDYITREATKDEIEYFIALNGKPREARYNGKLYRFCDMIYCLVNLGDDAIYGYLVERRATNGGRIFQYYRI